MCLYSDVEQLYNKFLHFTLRNPIKSEATAHKYAIALLSNLKPSSQYIAHVASWPEVIIFSMGFDASRIDFYSCVATRPNPTKKIMTSGRDATRAIYCELCLSVCIGYLPLMCVHCTTL